MYENRILAYLDILGFKETIIGSINKTTGEEIEQETDKINKLFENVLELYKKYDHIDCNINSKKISHFSDSIVISYSIEEEAGVFHILSNILFFCASIISDGYLIRGAITYGKLYHSENKLFGPAMLSVYDMEKKLAFYPRIIFEKEIIALAEKYPARFPSKTEQSKIIKKMIKKDNDGLYYLDYFNTIDYILGASEGLIAYLISFKDKIIELEKKIEDNSIKSKYLWLKEKYNIALKNVKIKYLNEKINIENKILYDFVKNEVYIK